MDGPLLDEDLAYRVNLAQRACLGHYYLAEAVPKSRPTSRPTAWRSTWAARRGEPGTVWCEPVREHARSRFELDKGKLYWHFTRRLAVSKSAWAGEIPQPFRPHRGAGHPGGHARHGAFAHRSDRAPRLGSPLPARDHRPLLPLLRSLYDLIRDEVGGSHFWAWAPGRMAKFQCDFSAMIGPSMFATSWCPCSRRCASASPTACTTGTAPARSLITTICSPSP